jgi:hypothetical protein
MAIAVAMAMPISEIGFRTAAGNMSGRTWLVVLLVTFYLLLGSHV